MVVKFHTALITFLQLFVYNFNFLREIAGYESDYEGDVEVVSDQEYRQEDQSTSEVCLHFQS